MTKLPFVAGLAAGYVLGTRAGKARYQQLKTGANKVWENPKVQEKVGQAQEAAKAKAPVIKEKATSAASNAASTAKDKVNQRQDKDLPETIHRGDDGELHADTSGFGPGGEKLP